MRILQLCILVLLGGFGAPFAAANDNAAPSSAPTGKTVSFLRLYTDANDVSHFAVEKMELKARGTEGIDAVMAVNRIGDVQGALFAALRAGSTEDWHVAPRRQFMVCLQGVVELTASDGEKRRVKPGEIVLLEDLTGKGHKTHAVGTEDHVALAIPLPKGAFPR
jgi:quercetin dioxygenase-like cupin family protein